MEDLKNHLERRYKPHLIATEDKDLVVEGYPRSANTFVVEFIRIVAGDHGEQVKFAHHTHDAKNVELGIKSGLPCLVLIREPLAAA